MRQNSIAEKFTSYLTTVVEHDSSKSHLLETWNNVQREGGYSKQGTDEEMRTDLLLQGQFEAFLATALKEKDIDGLVVCMHTPTPATPLRAEGDDIEKSDVSDNVLCYRQGYDSVVKRTNTVRDLLKKGATVISAYPNTDANKNIAGREIFDELEKRNPNLIDSKLNSFDKKHTGATYLISQNGETFEFSLFATQANNPVEGNDKEWGMQFGQNLQQVQEVDEYLQTQGVETSFAEELEASVRTISEKRNQQGQGARI